MADFESRSASTPEEMKRIIEEALARLPNQILSFDDHGNADPPWRAFPDYERFSMGWRMGGGEDYWGEFCRWYHALSADRRLEYRARFPEQAGWSGFYDDAERN